MYKIHRGDDGSIYITEKMKSNKCVLLFIVLISSFVTVVFCLPLVSVFLSDNSKGVDWIASLLIALIALVLFFLFIRVVSRGLTAWHVIIKIKDKNYKLTKQILICRWSKTVNLNSEITISPAYQRGDWGYSLWFELKNKKILLLPPRLISKNIERAKQDGFLIANKLALLLLMKTKFDKSWEKYARDAKQNLHNLQ